jgi:UPF0755 protein
MNKRNSGVKAEVKEAVRKDPYEKKPGPFTWLLRLAVLGVAVTVCVAAALLLYLQWLGSAGSGGASSLSSVERIYLQGYLAARSSDLEAPAGQGVQPLPFNIQSGQSANEIAASLVDAGLLQDQELFVNYVRFHGLDSELEAGTYLVDPRSTVPELAQTLTEAFAQEIEVRLLEGWRAEEMAQNVASLSSVQISAEEFMRIVNREQPFDLSSYSFAEEIPDGASLEGYLFPDTYRVPLDADAAYLVDLMLTNFDQRVTPAMREAFAANGLTLHEAVTLASIVERETPLAEERPMVATVFYNRLGQDMPLQADPTVQYAVGRDLESGSWWKSPLTQADLQLDSPYNTYVYPGLPPGPIANPGLATLEAVANPTPSNNLYFVADCNAEGAHLFSETYEQHLVKVEQCRQQ